MKWLGPILLIGVFARHNLSFSLPSVFTPQAWFYMLGGIWEATLCGCLLLLIEGNPLATAALWIGLLEGGQLSICRFLIHDISAVPKTVNLCDTLTGLPIGATMTGLYVILVCWAIGKSWRSASRS